MPRWAVDSETNALLMVLQQSASNRLRLFSRRRDPSLFCRIAARGQSGAIIPLLPYTLSGDYAEAAAAGAAVQHLVEPLIPEHVVALDEWLRARTRYGWYNAGSWSKLTPPGLARLLRLPDDMVPALLGVASCHHSGHVRQAAVEHLAHADTDIAIPFLLVRVNDWVAAVRMAARAALTDYLEPAKAARLVAFLPLFERLETTTRVDHTHLVNSLKSALGSPAARTALRAAARGDVVGVRRYASRLLLEARDEEPLRILMGAVTDPDPTLALWALREGPNSVAARPLSALLRRALAARPPCVRVQALRMVEAYLPDQAFEIHRSCLLDRGASVRTQAQWFLRSTRDDDVGSYYRGVVRNGAAPAAALLGLAETGVAADAPLIEPYVSHDSPRVRTAAVSALGRLSAAWYAASFVRALQDGSSKVSGAAAAILRMIRQPSTEQLWSILASARTRHVQRRALSLIADREKWSALVFLLRAAGHADSFLDGQVHQHLRRWLTRANRDFTVASAEELGLLRHLFLERSRHLDNDIREQVGFILRTSG